MTATFFRAFFILSVSCILSHLHFGKHGKLVGFVLVLNVFPNFLAVVLVCGIFASLKLAVRVTPVNLVVICYTSDNVDCCMSGNFFSAVPGDLSRTTEYSNTAEKRMFCGMVLPLSGPVVVCAILVNFVTP